MTNDSGRDDINKALEQTSSLSKRLDCLPHSGFSLS